MLSSPPLPIQLLLFHAPSSLAACSLGLQVSMLSRGIDRLMEAATRSLADDDSWLDVIQVGGPSWVSGPWTRHGPVSQAANQAVVVPAGQRAV